MRILLTGCAGFIGSKTTELALQDGHDVVGIDNVNGAYDVRLKQWRLERLSGRRGFTFHRMDITDNGALEGLGAQGAFDAVLHLAARAGVRQSVLDPWSYYETNVLGTLNLLEYCRRYDVPRLILSSTSSLYAGGECPFREDQPTDRLLSPYAASKKAAETLCHSYHHLYGINVLVLRYFTVYGPAGRPDMSLFRFIQWISEERPVTVFGDGRQSRDFTYVDDIARGTLAGLSLNGYEVINLGSDQPVVLMDAIRLIEDLVGKSAVLDYQPMHPADVMFTWADIEKARDLLGWQPRTRIEEGLKNSLAWYAENRAWAKDVQTS